MPGVLFWNYVKMDSDEFKKLEKDIDEKIKGSLK